MRMEELLVYFMMFITFCIFGWVWESIYMSVIERRIQNRGFLHGPYIPIYGFAGIIISLTMGKMYSNFLSLNTLKIYFVGILCATSLELVVSTLAEKILHKKLWDYTIYRINYKGKICLIASLFWGVIAVVFVQFLNPSLFRWYTVMAHDAKLITVTAVGTMMIFDTIVSFAVHTPIPDKLSDRYEEANTRWVKLFNRFD